jgi:hypothetical protein
VIRRPYATVALSLATGLLAACTAPAPTPSMTPSATPFDPRAALAASTIGVDEGGYAFSVIGPDFETSGAVHTPSGSAEILSVLPPRIVKQQAVNGMTRTRVAGGRTFMQWSLSGGGWDELDRDLERIKRSPDAESRQKAKEIGGIRDFFNGTYWMPPEALPAAATPLFDLRDPDVVGVKRLLSRVSSAQGDDRVITGTLDSSHLTDDRTVVGGLARLYPPRTGTAMPFRATLDSQDRIAALSLTTPGSSDTWVISLSEYGKVQPLTPPPADIVRKPPPAVVKLLRGADLSQPA